MKTHARLVLILAVSSAAYAAGPVLVEKGQNPCPIIVGPEAGKPEMNAARELAKYLGQISGATFEVQAADGELPMPSVVLTIATGEATESLGVEGFSLQVRDGRLHLTGGGPRGLWYGVYGFLEDQLGCRWWSHTEEDVPTKPTIQLPELNVVVKPPFAMHNLYTREAQSRTNSFLLKRRGTSTEHFSGGHTLCPYLKPYATENPHFLPMGKDGKRKFNNLHMCYAAEGMPEALAEALGKLAAKRKGNLEHTVFFAGLGDWYGGMCRCDTCNGVYRKETWTDPDGRQKRGYIATLIQMMNKTAEILEKQYPGIRIGTFAYMSLEAPPATVRPRENVVIRIPHLRHRIVHGVEHCSKNGKFLRNLEQWVKIAPDRVFIWDYGINFSNFLYPFPNLKAIAQNIKSYHKLGVRGVMIQGNYVSTGSDLIAMRNYVWGKLLWDPSLDVDKLIGEFCQGYYGPAGNEMIEYVNALESSVREPKPVHLDEFEKNIRGKYLSKELDTRLRGILGRALEKAAGQEHYERRVKEALVGVESAELWRPGPLVEKGDRLVRADLGDTWERAQELVRHCRSASPREWGSGKAYRMGFLTLHGGPLGILKGADLEVRVAPSLNGRIRGIRFKGNEILHVPTADSAESPNRGGSCEKLSPGARIYELAGDPDGKTVSLEAELGVSMWGGRAKQIARKQVQLTDDGRVRVTGNSRHPQGRASKISATSVTEYRAAEGLDGVTVEHKRGDGAWQPVEILETKPDPETTERNLPALSALRIRLAAKGVQVVDTYLAPTVQKGYVWFDGKRKALVVELALGTVEVPAKAEGQYLLREIEVGAAERPQPE